MSPFFDFNSDFVMYGGQHITAIILTFCISVGFPIFAKRHFSQQQHLWISRLMAVLISIWVILYDLILLYLGKFNYRTDLPLDICNLMGLLLPFLTWKLNKRLFPYLYFYVMAGTTQAVFNPHLFNGFPNFIFIKFWIVHGGLIIYILYVAVVWEYRILVKDLWRSFLALQVYLLVMFILNRLIGSNYLYVIEIPPTESVILEYFGPWPYYILVGQLIFLFLSFMVYLPYLKLNRKNKPIP